MNKKERRLALATALQSAASDVVVVDDIKQAAGAHSLTHSVSSSRVEVSATVGAAVQRGAERQAGSIMIDEVQWAASRGTEGAAGGSAVALPWPGQTQGVLRAYAVAAAAVRVSRSAGSTVSAACSGAGASQALFRFACSQHGQHVSATGDLSHTQLTLDVRLVLFCALLSCCSAVCFS
jgi:hypothetical protein